MKASSRSLLASYTLLTAMILSVLPASVSAQSNRFDKSRLERIDQVLQTYVDNGEIAGAVALVQQNGRTVYEQAVGWADREANREMTTTSTFRIASQTKALTSVVILSLMEEGKLNLSDPVSRFIPAFESATVAELDGDQVNIVPVRRAITLFDLLTHTAGISYGTQPHIADQYRARGLGEMAGIRPTRMSPSAQQWNDWPRFPLWHIPAKPSSMDTIPMCWAVLPNASLARRWTNLFASGSPARWTCMTRTFLCRRKNATA